MSDHRPRDPFRNARLGPAFDRDAAFSERGAPDDAPEREPRARRRAGGPLPGAGEPEPPGPAADPLDDAPDPAQLGALIAELQAMAEQLTGQLGDLSRAGRDAAANAREEHLPVLRRLLEVAPPELRQRIAGAATAGLTATRDLADWVLAQMHQPAARAEPEELTIAPLGASTVGRVPTTWILTASVDNHRATEAAGFSVIGIKERNRRRAMEIEPGDVIVLYLTRVMAFAGAIRVTGDLYEDRTPIWPGKPGNPDLYPWRFATEPLVVLPREAWVPAASVQAELEHVRKWPAEHWKLAFQGQLRTVSGADADLLLDRLHAAAGAAAA